MPTRRSPPLFALALAFLMVLPACGSPPAASPSTAAPSAGEARCAVWGRELSFARAAQEHDRAAFREHVLEGAVFVIDGESHRGRDAIEKGWDPLLSGDTIRIEWRPDEVIVTGDPHVASSRGPAWIEVAKPGAPKRFLLARFHSVWVLDKDGAWRAAIDGAGPPAKEVTEEEIAKSKAATPTACPVGPG